MLHFLSRIWYGFRDIFLPMGKEVKFRTLGPGLRWTIHFLVLALIVGGLYYLNNYGFLTPLQSWVQAKWAKPIWLPLIFLLMYFVILVGWRIWILLGVEPEASRFPELDAAWDEAVHALALAGLPLKNIPMFLVLGRPETGEQPLFQAAHLALVVKQAPAAPEARLHVYANHDAIFVTCPGASLLGKHAANIALEGIEQMGAGVDVEDDGAGNVTIRGKGKVIKVIRRLDKIAGRPMNLVERRATRRELGLSFQEVLTNSAEVEERLAMLAHLGRLMVRDRQPLPALNGILVLAPLGGTDTDHDAQQTAEVCARDLAALRRATMLHCPLFVLGCDLEALPGFCDFIERVSPKERLGRLGQRFALAPDLEREALIEQIDKSIFYMCNHYLRDWMYRLFRVEGTTTTNTNLYLLLDEMRSRRKNLSRLLTHGIAKNAPTPLLYGGCYLAATGADREREQAFVAGVLRRLTENQDYVSWTDEALAEDAKCHRRASIGYALLATMTLVLVAAGYFFFGPRLS